LVLALVVMVDTMLALVVVVLMDLVVFDSFVLLMLTESYDSVSSGNAVGSRREMAS
jgi:hypothetical protein